jgi:hypothetical protein
MIRVGVILPGTVLEGGEYLADVRALEAAGADTIALDADGYDQWVVWGAIAAVTSRIKLRLSSDGPSGTLQAIGRGRVIVGEPAGETWLSLPMPPDRGSWAEQLREAEAAGATGVMVRWDPRLIDLLRNTEPEDRSDLLMSTG